MSHLEVVKSHLRTRLWASSGSFRHEYRPKKYSYKLKINFVDKIICIRDRLIILNYFTIILSLVFICSFLFFNFGSFSKIKVGGFRCLNAHPPCWWLCTQGYQKTPASNNLPVPNNPKALHKNYKAFFTVQFLSVMEVQNNKGTRQAMYVLRNNEARSCNHYCSAKATSVT